MSEEKVTSPQISVWRQLFSVSERVPLWFKIFLGVAAVVMASLFWRIAVKHAEENNVDLYLNDQKVYLNGSATLKGSGYTYAVPRMRMPGYMYVLSVVADPEVDHYGFFSLAKKYNIGVSLVCLGILFVVARIWLGTILATCFLLISTWQLFIFRAPYVQPEVMYMTLIIVAMAMLVEVFRSPLWWKAILAGLFCCIWHLTKSSALMAIGGFTAAMLVKILFAGKGNRLRYSLAGVLVLIFFVAPMTPYLAYSKQKFGSAFFNAQSRFYMWSLNDEEKRYMQELKVDVDLNAIDPVVLANLPSPQNYLKLHTWEEIEGRLLKGTEIMIRNAYAEYGPLFFWVIAWIGIMLWAMSRNFALVVEGLKRHWVEVTFVTVLTAIFVFVFGWFTQMKVGPRLLITVAQIPLFFTMLVTHRCLKGETETLFGVKVPMERLLLLAFLVPWLAITVWHVPEAMENGYFGG